jgi:hypothetical protein
VTRDDDDARRTILARRARLVAAALTGLGLVAGAEACKGTTPEHPPEVCLSVREPEPCLSVAPAPEPEGSDAGEPGPLEPEPKPEPKVCLSQPAPEPEPAPGPFAKPPPNAS